MKEKRDGRWVWLPLTLAISAAKNGLLAPRVDWGIDRWALIEVPLTGAMITAFVAFVQWARARKNRRP